MEEKSQVKETKKIVLLIAMILGLAGLLVVSSKYMKDNPTIRSKVPAVVSGTVKAPANFQLRKKIEIKADSQLILQPGVILVPDKAEILVKGRLVWPVNTLEKILFKPADDAVTSSLTIKYEGNGEVLHAAFAGISGPVGDPRMRLSVSATGDLILLDSSCESVGTNGDSPVFSAGGTIKVTSCRFRKDNHIAPTARTVFSCKYLSIEGMVLEALTGFEAVARASIINSENLVIRGVSFKSFVKGNPQELVLERTKIAASSFDEGFVAAKKIIFDRAALSGRRLVAIAAPEVQVSDSYFSAQAISVNCNQADLRNSIFAALENGIAIGDVPPSRNQFTVARCTGTFMENLFCFDIPPQHAVVAFAQGLAEQSSSTTGEGSVFFFRNGFIVGENAPEFEVEESATFENCITYGEKRPEHGRLGEFPFVMKTDAGVSDDFLNCFSAKPGLETILKELSQ